MSKDRVARIDTDIEHSGRQKVIDYITKKYGVESVCRIVTFGTLAAKMGIKDVSRALGYPPSWANGIAKLIPNEVKMTIQKALDGNPELKERYESDPDVAKVVGVAKRLEGNNRHASQHACFDADTLITTETGLKRIVDISVGEKVLTHNGRFKEIVDTIVTDTDTVYEVSFYGAKKIEVTGNHPLLVRPQVVKAARSAKGNKTTVRTLGAKAWKTVQDLEADDYIGIPINNEAIIPCVPGLPTSNPAFWWIIGRYIGDGWTEIYHRKSICPNHTERRIIICCDKNHDEVKEITEHLDLCGITYRVETSRTTKKVFLDPQKVLYDYLQSFGRYAHGKFLTSDILNLPITLAGSFLEGYMSADGCYNKKFGSYSVKTVSKSLAMGVSLLVNKVYHVATGFTEKSERTDVIEGRIVHSKKQYVLSFIIGNRTRKKYFYDDGCLWVRLKSVTCKSVKKKMYNLTVIDDSSYQANGIAAHNCGLVIAPGDVSNFLPTSMEKDKETGERGLTSQVVMTEVEELSLIKMDLLGLKNLTAIHEVIDTIKRTRGIDMVYQDIPLDDRATYQMLAKGITGGVFQLEGVGMTNNVIVPMLTDVDSLPDDRMHECFERLIAAVALYRPGPMDYIPNYIAGMRDVNSIHYLTPELVDILKPTYGVIVYQEQVMQIVQKLAGYSLGRADVVRKAMGKKKHDVMDAEKEVFLYGNRDAFEAGKDKNYAPGCIANGIPEDIAQQIWAQMEKFASYAFNRSHAACYAWIANITAYMACHWGPEFYCAMMNAFEDIGDKVKSYMALAIKRGIKILPPDINRSMDRCTVDDGCIRLGFHTLTHLNKFSRLIIQERDANGPFADCQDFYERMTDLGKKPSKNILESLIFSGAMDQFGLNRNQMLQLIPRLESNYKKDAVNRALEQTSLFSATEIRVSAPVAAEFGDRILMEKEKAAIGFYLTKHPVDELFASNGSAGCISITDLLSANSVAANEDGIYEDCGEGEDIYVSTYAILKEIKTIYTKNNEEMFFLVAEDRFSELQCVLFPKRVAANKHRLEEGALVKLVGYFRIDEQRGPQLQIQEILSAEEVKAVNSSSVTITVHNREEQDMLMKFVAENPGCIAVNLFARNKVYETSHRIQMTPAILDFLKTHFSKVEV